MSDAASRFYQRVHERHIENQRLKAEPDRLSEADLVAGNHRYSAAYLYLRDNPGLAVCELGYGTADTVRHLAGHAGDYHVVDIVEHDQPDDVHSNVHSLVHNLDNDFPFADRSFDVVVAMMVIEHLYDPFHAFSEVARILRPGGHAFVNLPNIAGLKSRFALLMGRMPVTSTHDWFDRREWDGNHLHYFTVKDTERLAGLHGLDMTGVQPVGNRPRLKALRPSLLSPEITYTFRKRD